MKKTMSVYYDDYFLFMLRLFVKLYKYICHLRFKEAEGFVSF